MLKTGPILLRIIPGPVFNTTLDQSNTRMCVFSWLFLSFGAETTIVIVFAANNTNFKDTPKRENTLFVITPALAALVKMSVFLHFSFLGFDRWPKLKIIKKQRSKNKKQTNTKNKLQIMRNSSLVSQNKTKEDNKQKQQSNIFNKKQAKRKQKARSPKRSQKRNQKQILNHH